MPIKGTIEIANRIRTALVQKVPKRIAADAERHFKMSFRHQGFIDETLVPWKPTEKPRANSRGKVLQGRILKRTGLLVNSIRVLRADWNRVEITAGGQHVPYAQIHNEGGRIQGTFNVRAHTRRKRDGSKVPVRAFQRKVNTVIPQRQFMGDSFKLRQTMRQTILRTISEALNDR